MLALIGELAAVASDQIDLLSILQMAMQLCAQRSRFLHVWTKRAAPRHHAERFQDHHAGLINLSAFEEQAQPANPKSNSDASSIRLSTRRPRRP